MLDDLGGVLGGSWRELGGCWRILWGPLGALGDLGLFWKDLGGPLGDFGMVLGGLGESWGGACLPIKSFKVDLGEILGYLGGVLGGSWGDIVPFWGAPEVSWRYLGGSWRKRVAFWKYLGGSQVVAKMVEFLMSPAMRTPIAANFKRISTNPQRFIQLTIKSVC